MRFIVLSAALLASSSAFACAMRPIKDHGPDLVALMEAVDAVPATPAVVEPAPQVAVAEVTPAPAPAVAVTPNARPSVIPEARPIPMATPRKAVDPS